MKTKKFIFAGTYKQYINYLQERELNRIDYIYLYKASQIVGIRDFEIIRCGSWWENPDKVEIADIEKAAW